VGGVAPERPYSAPPSQGAGPGPLAFQCFDAAGGDPELALLLAVRVVQLEAVLGQPGARARLPDRDLELFAAARLP
jgi:hypothetical protein